MVADILPKLAEFEREDINYYPRPSLAGPERCIRQLVYWGMGIPRQSLPGRALLIFDDSKWHEDLTADWIRKSAFQIHSEQMKIEIKNEHIPNFKGSIDYMLTDLAGKDILVEHKAINHFTFQRIAQGDLPPDYITQLCLYLRGIQQSYNPDIKDGLLLIKNKNTAQYLEIQLQYEFDKCYIDQILMSTGEKKEINKEIENITEDALKKFVSINEYKEKKILPSRQYEIGDWRCQYCGWGEKCWENWDKEIEQMEVDKVLDKETSDAIHYYLELQMHQGEIKKERDDLQKKIKNMLKAKNIKQGKTDEYIVSLNVQNRKEFVVPASKFEVLNVRKIKKGE